MSSSSSRGGEQARNRFPFVPCSLFRPAPCQVNETGRMPTMLPGCHRARTATSAVSFVSSSPHGMDGFLLAFRMGREWTGFGLVAAVGWMGVRARGATASWGRQSRWPQFAVFFVFFLPGSGNAAAFGRFWQGQPARAPRRGVRDRRFAARRASCSRMLQRRAPRDRRSRFRCACGVGVVMTHDS